MAATDVWAGVSWAAIRSAASTGSIPTCETAVSTHPRSLNQVREPLRFGRPGWDRFCRVARLESPGRNPAGSEGVSAPAMSEFGDLFGAPIFGPGMQSVPVLPITADIRTSSAVLEQRLVGKLVAPILDGPTGSRLRAARRVMKARTVRSFNLVIVARSPTDRAPAAAVSKPSMLYGRSSPPPRSSPAAVARRSPAQPRSQPGSVRAVGQPYSRGRAQRMVASTSFRQLGSQRRLVTHPDCRPRCSVGSSGRRCGRQDANPRLGRPQRGASVGDRVRRLSRPSPQVPEDMHIHRRGRVDVPAPGQLRHHGGQELLLRRL